VVPWFDHPRAFLAKAARVLDGRSIETAQLSGFLNSRYDRFLNQLFAQGSVTAREAAEALEGRRGFVWLTEESPDAIVMAGMTATTEPRAALSVDAEIVDVRAGRDLDAWHTVYCEVFGGDPRAREDWRRIHEALGPSGDDSLVLLLARVDGSPAATGGIYLAEGWAGLYWFTTRAEMRGRGLASGLVEASHDAARARGVERGLLHATPMGRRVYTRAGYAEARPLPVLVSS
jgi:GNAT superfamily N-acetyltransferase